MASQTWLGNAAPVAQVTVLTPATPSVNDTFTVTCNSKAVSYQTAVGTVADVCNGVANALANATFAEFKEFQATNTGTTIQLAGQTAGLPFTVSLGVTTSGSATFTQSTTTSATGPNDWANGANWSTGSAPATGDDVYFSTGTVPVLYNLAQSGVTLDSLNVAQSYTGTIGLPTYNTKAYREYRTMELQIGATTINIGTGSSGSGSGRVKLNTGSVAGTLNVYNTGQPLDVGNPSLVWHGTNSSNVVNLTKANIGIAFFPGDTASMTTLRTGYVSNKNSDVTLTVGAGASVSTLDMNGGTVTINNGATTATISAGTLTVLGSGGITTLTADGGSVVYNTTGTLGTAIVSESGSLDFSQDPRPKTVTNPVQLYGNNATLNDPNQVVGSLVVDLEQSDNLANIALGTNIKLTRSTPP
jgi:trimeric autotransporter adhesin